MNCKARPITLRSDMPAKADAIADFLKGLANPHRLLILCALGEGERNVSELIEITGIAPTSMSQHLAKLKAEGILGVRRQHRSLFYFIAHDAARAVMGVLYDNFCRKD
jgi:ArsR family transcriptional regulator